MVDLPTEKQEVTVEAVVEEEKGIKERMKEERPVMMNKKEEKKLKKKEKEKEKKEKKQKDKKGICYNMHNHTDVQCIISTHVMYNYNKIINT